MRCFFRLSLLASVPARAPTPDYPDRAGASIEILPSSCPSETRAFAAPPFIHPWLHRAKVEVTRMKCPNGRIVAFLSHMVVGDERLALRAGRNPLTGVHRSFQARFDSFRKNTSRALTSSVTRRCIGVR